MADAPKPNPRAELLSQLASKHAQDVIDALVEVIKDKKSRQRVAACLQLTDLMVAAPPPAERVQGTMRTKMTEAEALDIWRASQAQHAKRANGNSEE